MVTFNCLVLYNSTNYFAGIFHKGICDVWVFLAPLGGLVMWKFEGEQQRQGSTFVTFFLLLSLWVKPFSPVWNVPIIWATGSMNLLRTNKLVLYDFMFVLSSYTFLEMGQGNKTGKTKNSDSLKTIKDREVCAKASGEPWACWTQNIHSPVPWLHKVLLLDNTQNISTDVLYIPRNACYLFVSIYYLFIYLVCGFECIFMHTYYTLCFWASCEGCIVTQS